LPGNPRVDPEDFDPSSLLHNREGVNVAAGDALLPLTRRALPEMVIKTAANVTLQRLIEENTVRRC
jgi:hypothetical protein